MEGSPVFFFFFFFIYLFLAALGLHCCAQAFSSCGEQGLLFIVVRRLLIAVACCGARALGAWASVVVTHGLGSCGARALERKLSSCGTQAFLLRGMWDLPGPGIEPVFPALAGGFLTTAPPRKSEGSPVLLDGSISLPCLAHCTNPQAISSVLAACFNQDK